MPAHSIKKTKGAELPSITGVSGQQGFVLIDEAAFHDDLGEVLKAAFALLIWGGKKNVYLPLFKKTEALSGMPFSFRL